MLIPYPHDRKYRNVNKASKKEPKKGSKKENLLNSVLIEFYTHRDL
ncbi:MAG TPA: hypothetical protein GXX63_03895 [Tissierellia bacterium]|nr:hypothetical protein [Tissierellia bacterium]